MCSMKCEMPFNSAGSRREPLRIQMPTETLKGSCLCGAVKFEATPPLAGFRYCHCGRCQKASGSAHAANIFLPQGQVKWLAGESLITKFDVPDAKRFSVWFCSVCAATFLFLCPNVCHCDGYESLFVAGNRIV